MWRRRSSPIPAIENILVWRAVAQFCARLSQPVKNRKGRRRDGNMSPLPHSNTTKQYTYKYGHSCKTWWSKRYADTGFRNHVKSRETPWWKAVRFNSAGSMRKAGAPAENPTPRTCPALKRWATALIPAGRRRSARAGVSVSPKRRPAIFPSAKNLTITPEIMERHHGQKPETQ